MSFEITQGPYGNCPVQAEGTIDGRIWYFRARGDRWSFEVWSEGVPWKESWLGSELPDEDPEWFHSGSYGPKDDFRAGWMDEDEAEDLIALAAARYFMLKGSDHDDCEGEEE